MDCARFMRFHAGFPLQFQADAVNTAIYLINRGPSSALDGGIPEEEWTSKQVKYLGGSHYHVTFIDDRTRKTVVYCIRKKYDVFDTLRS